MNQEAMAKMHCRKKLEIIPSATHLFEEPGKLETVAHLAKSWFIEYLAPDSSSTEHSLSQS